MSTHTPWTTKDVIIIIPAHNEMEIIQQTIASIPLEYDILVINNNSTDKTAQRVQESRAVLIQESRQGYGQAVYTGILEGIRKGYHVGVVFDADAANDPQDIHQVVTPICQQTHDLCLAQRTKYAEPESLTAVQAFGNRLACTLIALITGYRFSDMGSMRAFPLQKIKELGLEDRDYGWNIEMQIKAVRNNWQILEKDLPYRKRQGGISKISGDKRAVFSAGKKIISTAFRYAR